MSELPSHWASATVGEVAEVRSGYASGKHNATGAGIPHLRPMNVSRVGAIDLTEVKYVAADVDDRRLVPGDILFNNTNSPALVGKTAVFGGGPGEFGFSNHMTRLRTTSSANPRFVAAQLHYLWMTGALSHLIKNHVNQASISAKVLAGQVTLALPPLPEQEQIVAAIDEHLTQLEAASTTTTDAARRLDRLVASATLAFTQDWDVAPLGDLSEVVTKGTTPTTLGFSYVQEGIRFVKAESLAGGRIAHERCAAIEAEAHDALRRSALHAGDVLVTIAGTLGRVAQVAEEDLPANTNQAVAIVRLVDPTLGAFLRRWLSSPAGQKGLLAGGRGVGLQNLNLAQIRSLLVPVPGRADQAEFCEAFDEMTGAVERLRDAIRFMERRSTALHQAVLGAAFSGQLVQHHRAVHGDPEPNRTQSGQGVSEHAVNREASAS